MEFRAVPDVAYRLAGFLFLPVATNRGWQRRQKAVAVLLLALAVDFQTRHAAAAFVCPQGCSCQPGDELVSCVGLTTVPRYFGRSPKVLKITQHRITKLSSKSFRGLERLEELEISDGRLFEISDDAFSSLRHLRAVNLSHNELSLVPRDAFAACARLEQLDLSWNPLVLPSRGAALASPSLAALDVSSCGLSRLPERALSLLPALSELRLRDNGLRQVSACALPPDHRLVLLDVDPGVEWLACAPQPEVSTAAGRGRPAREQPPPGDHWLGLAQLALVPSLEQWVFLTVAALVVVLLLACIRRACKPEERPKEHMYEILGGNQAAHLPVAPYTDLRISRISTSTCETFGDSARVSMADGESRQYLPNYFPTVPASQS